MVDEAADYEEPEVSPEDLREWSVYQIYQAAQWQSDGFLYHYTDIGGLKGILDDAQVWGTHVLYLNDTQEFSYGVESMCKMIKSYGEEMASGEDDTTNELMKVLTDITYDGVEKSIATLEEDLGPFVSCFSKSVDDLNQWRGYAKGGYAIKFDPKILEQSVEQVIKPGDDPLPDPLHKPPLIEVEYIPERQHDRIRRLVNENFNRLIDGFKDGTNEEGENPEFHNIFTRARDELIEEVIPLAASIKYTKFVGEAEHRLVSRAAPTFYTPSPLGLIPRVRFGFSREAIRGITVGPGEFSEVKKSSIERYLRSRYPDVAVIPSDVPYREL